MQFVIGNSFVMAQLSCWDVLFYNTTFASETNRDYFGVTSMRECDIVIFYVFSLRDYIDWRD